MTYLPGRNLRYIAVAERYATIESPVEISKRCKLLVDKKKKSQRQLAKSKEPARAVSLNDEEESWDEMGFEYAEVSRNIALW